MQCLCGEIFMVREFIHPDLGEPVTAIGGYYVLEEECRISLDGREVLCFLGHAVIDTSCCGVGGAGYALVPGVIVSPACREDDRGRPISLLEPVNNPVLQARISARIQERATITQINFI